MCTLLIVGRSKPKRQRTAAVQNLADVRTRAKWRSFWSAAVPCRFELDRQASRDVHTVDCRQIEAKAAEDCRSPKPGGSGNAAKSTDHGVTASRSSLTSRFISTPWTL